MLQCNMLISEDTGKIVETGIDSAEKSRYLILNLNFYLRNVSEILMDLNEKFSKKTFEKEKGN